MIVEHQHLRSLAARILCAGGCRPAEAETVADHLVEANLRGHDSHGVGLLPGYCGNLASGKLIPNQKPEIVLQSDSIAVWDGRAGFGQVLARDAMRWAIAAARKHGIAMHGLRNTHHIARVGTYGEMAAEEGLVSLHFVNGIAGVPVVAPFRGREGRFATNPICIAIPGTSGTPPVILDFATSRIAMGKVRVALNAGKPVMPGVLLDAAGRATTDPGVMWSEQRGAALPFGEHKGSGLALICDLLAGAIVGSGTVHAPGNPDRGVINGMLTIVFDPTRLSSRPAFEAEIDAIIAWVKSAAAADPDLPVLVAGEPERLTRAERLANGIPIDDTTWAQICEAATQLQVPVETA
jgi:uncharacterized oxidoreductase